MRWPRSRGPSRGETFARKLRVALVLTIIVAPLTVAVAWLFYRPMISLGIVALGAALAYGVMRVGVKNRTASMTEPSAA
ncbi:hypothetical protein [Pseudorhodoplanes sp.]|uniref:hypothetical protein n=1 Tax=Pseudorhodoplanes sp. TaxID=1934341 RepID=UPI002BEDB62B|nr:hypothetical protein [Pseudorhodoplanes sp.]HWV55728.1 hypothetical protein [Pseudorhodoplanes sp.]